MKCVYVIPMDQHRKVTMEVIVLESGKFVGTQEDRRLPAYHPVGVLSRHAESTQGALTRTARP